MLAGIGDRMSRGTALAVAHGAVAVATALTLLALAADAPTWLVIAASTTVTTTVAVVRPIHYATLPQLANSADELVSGNALSAAGEQFAFFAGPLIAGVGVQRSGPALVMALAVGASLAGTLLCLRLRLVSPDAAAVDDGEGGLGAALDGLRALRSDWGSLALLLLMTTTFVVGGALDVLGVAYSESVLGEGEAGAGLIIGAIGIGGLLGAGIASGVAGRRYLAPPVVVAGLATGGLLATVSGARELLPVVGLIALTGVAAAVLMVCSRTLLQRATDDHVLTRVFAVQESASLLGIAVGAAMAPLLIGWFSPAAAFLPLGLLVVLAVIVGATLIPRLDARAVFRPREVQLLRHVAFFDLLPAYELERLAQRARWAEVRTGDVVIAQGDDGHDFYVVEEGEFSVTVDGELKPHRIGAKGSFGEIALLQDVPRTATITALTAGRLVSVSRPDFLAAVTGSSDGVAMAREVASAHMKRDGR
jgi:MFS family permease